MHERKFWDKKIYPTYEPYPFSRDEKQQTYLSKSIPQELPRGSKHQEMEEFSLITDPVPFQDWVSPEPIVSYDKQKFHPLRLLNSLFSDRLNFLQRALEELQNAQNERKRLTQDALEELDSEIKECEHLLSLTLLNNPEQKRHLQRRLFELKRERRKEALLSWRDFVWIKNEIRKIQREIDSIRKTAGSAQNHKNKG